jgi:U4/U6.U5 tri-snRNP-associated protein 1
VKNKRELYSSLKGATLGDPDTSKDEDTLKWIKRSRKKEKELAKKRLQELNNMDDAALADYSESMHCSPTSFMRNADWQCVEDLAGLKVAHDMETLGEGEEQILTLKDSRILDNEGLPSIFYIVSTSLTPSPEDELQNVELAEHERTRKNNELKIKKRDYTGYDDDEFTSGAPGGGGVEIAKKKILAKYDEELEGGGESVCLLFFVLCSLFSKEFALFCGREEVHD